MHLATHSVPSAGVASMLSCGPLLAVLADLLPAAGQLLGRINWRIPKGKNDFIDRSTVQKFKQVRAPARPPTSLRGLSAAAPASPSLRQQLWGGSLWALGVGGAPVLRPAQRPAQRLARCRAVWDSASHTSCW